MSNNYRKSQCCKTCTHQRSKECWYGDHYNHQVCDDGTCDGYAPDKPHDTRQNRFIWMCSDCNGHGHGDNIPCYLVMVGPNGTPPFACTYSGKPCNWERIVRYNDIINILKGQ